MDSSCEAIVSAEDDCNCYQGGSTGNEKKRTDWGYTWDIQSIRSTIGWSVGSNSNKQKQE